MPGKVRFLVYLPPSDSHRMPYTIPWSMPTQRQNAALECFQRIQHGFDARNFMCAKEIGLAEGSEYGKERFGAADFVLKKFKGMRQRMTNRKAECAQLEGVEENV